MREHVTRLCAGLVFILALLGATVLYISVVTDGIYPGIIMMPIGAYFTGAIWRVRRGLTVKR